MTSTRLTSTRSRQKGEHAFQLSNSLVEAESSVRQFEQDTVARIHTFTFAGRNRTTSSAENCGVHHADRNDAAQAKRNGRAADPVLSVVAGDELSIDGNDGALMNTPRATAGA